MIKFEFKFNGKPLDSRNLEDAIMRATLEHVAVHLRERIGAIRDPETGEFPTIVVSADQLDNISVQVEGSARVRELVSARLELETLEPDDNGALPMPDVPRVFLSYGSEDRYLAEHIARALMDAGVDTWWDGWAITAGDSIRRKVEEGIEGCTHFVVLLTPTAVTKPWVNEEIDAGFMRKVGKQARFIALRHDLDAEQLPALLRSSASPALGDPPDLTQLISDIHGITRKPALGSPPRAVAERAKTDPGYSAAANAVARVFVEETKFARKFDPCLTHEELGQRTGLSEEDVIDALHELNAYVRVERYRPVLPLPALFVRFDPNWKDWNPAEDGLAMAAAMLNDAGFPTDPAQIDTRLGWGPRRLNPAIAYLEDRNLVRVLHAMDGSHYVCHHLAKTDATRRFVKSRA
jgi:hypothetical protein